MVCSVSVGPTVHSICGTSSKEASSVFLQENKTGVTQAARCRDAPVAAAAATVATAATATTATTATTAHFSWIYF